MCSYPRKLSGRFSQTMTLQDVPRAFPTVDVPDHAHYTIGAVILIVGITGTLGNFMVLYAFCRSRSLQTPANILIINLAISDFLMSITQSPVFFTSSLYKHWIFGEKGAYVPEGLLTSCSWDYMTFTPSVRAYTMLLFCFVFFIPLIAIIYSYVSIFEAIKKANKSIQTFGGKHGNKEFQKQYQRMKNEWKMAKIALIVILFFVISWSPYSVVALVAFAGYSHVLTPFMNSIPAVIAKASVIHNPIIYAITHPKYREKSDWFYLLSIRRAIATHVPCLGPLLRVSPKDSWSFSSYHSSRRTTVTSQSSAINGLQKGRRRLSSLSDSESGCTETETDTPSMFSRLARRQISYETDKDTIQTSEIRAKLTSQDSGNCGKTAVDADDILMVELNITECMATPTQTSKTCSLEEIKRSESLNSIGQRKGESHQGSSSAQIPSITVTYSSVQGVELPSRYNSGFLHPKSSSHKQNKKFSS
ncbi:melanopsin isoform X6 [Catharus ustulatus]|uniref:melanopsin isoform X6 n=1 Tax=Catharus ustulatus TaxID=91951 RepID=UPI00140A27F9|nr:melanopsin isoform X6 [Catharus ustulatus]